MNLDELEFTAYNGEEYFKITFFRNTEERVSKFVLVAGDSESYAERVLDAAKPTLFSVEQHRQDFRQLREAMEENCSIIYQFTDKETYERLFDRQHERITRPMSTEEFRAIIAPIVARAGCIHTSL